MAGAPGLFLLVAILAKAFFTLVRRHLVAFSFLSAGHIVDLLDIVGNQIMLLHLP